MLYKTQQEKIYMSNSYSEDFFPKGKFSCRKVCTRRTRACSLVRSECPLLAVFRAMAILGMLDFQMYRSDILNRRCIFLRTQNGDGSKRMQGFRKTEDKSLFFREERAFSRCRITTLRTICVCVQRKSIRFYE